MITKQQLQNQIDCITQRVRELEYERLTYEAPDGQLYYVGMQKEKITPVKLLRLIKSLADKCGYSVKYLDATPSCWYVAKEEATKKATR